MKKVRIGVIGCGKISGAYLSAAAKFPILETAACSDINMEVAKAKGEEYGVPKVCTVDELLADPNIDIVVNLTIPAAHAEISLKTLAAGKCAYTEKPFAVVREDGLKVIETARQKGLRVGCAPDTFLGGGLQTCRKLIDDGWIGKPVGASAFMMGHGPEHWHENPEFFYKAGGGPLFDMGPYYLTALVNLLGPVQKVASSATISFPQRLITSKPKYGTLIDVEVPTHVNGILHFAGGAVGTITTSFDVWGSRLPRIEVYGTEGTLSVPDPNTFGGPVSVWRAGEWKEVPLTHVYTENYRSIGAADMAYAMQSGRAHRASGDLAFHVLDIMQSLYDAAEKGATVTLSSTCERPAPLPMGLREGTLDE
jgi:predicted dehydrogenase